jgi:uncharacterized membrane protein
VRAKWTINLLVAIGFLVLEGSAAARYLSGHGAFYDIGVMDNLFWQTLHGRLFYYPQYGMSYFGDHFTPIFFFVLPFYTIAPHALTLLAVQSLALCLGAIPLYGLTQHYLARSDAATHRNDPGDSRLATTVPLAVAFLYLSNISLLSIGMFDFHPVAFMVPLSLWAMHSFEMGRRRTMWLAVLLLLFTAEEAAITVAVFGLYLVAFGGVRGNRKDGAAIILLCTVYFVVTMTWVIPGFQGAQRNPEWLYLSRYGHLGTSFGEVLGTIVFSPAEALRLSFALYKGETLALLFLPLALLPLIGWRALLIALPCLAYNYLSSREHQFTIHYHYLSPALGWLFVAAAQGVAATYRWATLLPIRNRRSALIILTLTPVMLGVAFNGWALLRAGPIRSEFFRAPAHQDKLRRVREMIPDDASVSASNTLGAIFAHRSEYYLSLDFIYNKAIDKSLNLPRYRDTDFHLFDITRFEPSEDRERRVAQLLRDDRYGVRFFDFPILLFEKGYKAPDDRQLRDLFLAEGVCDSTEHRRFHALLLHRNEDANFSLGPFGSTSPELLIRFLPHKTGIVFGPYVRLAAGYYDVTFMMRLDESTQGRFAEVDVASHKGARVHARRAVRGGDIAHVGTLEPIRLAFRLQEPVPDIEFRTFSLGRAGFALHSVCIRSASDQVF